MLENKKMGYLGFLDGLRALSIIFVVIYHYNNAWLKGGFLGVDIFFVISGFIITQLLYTEYQHNKKISFSSFYVRRFHRILPAMIILIATILAFSYVKNSASVEQTLKDAPASLLFFLNWKYIFTNNSYFATTETPPLLEHLWSLSIEFQFYILWPFIFSWLIKRNPKVTIYFAGVFALSSYLYMGLSYQSDLTDKTYFDTFCRAGAFFMGAATNLIFNEYSSVVHFKLKTALSRLFYPALAGIIFLSYTLDEQSLALFQYGFFVNALLVSILLISSLVILAERGRSTILDNGLLRKIGVISYSLYLWHWPIICSTNQLNEFEFIKTNNPQYIHFALVLFLTFSAAITSYYLIEKPFRGVKKLSTLTAITGLVILLVAVQLFPAQTPIETFNVEENLNVINSAESNAKNINVDMNEGLIKNNPVTVIEQNTASINTLNSADSNLQNISADKSEDLNKNSPSIVKEVPDTVNKEKPKQATGGAFFKRNDIAHTYQENGYLERVYVDKSKSKKRKIYAIGDSVMLGASDALLKTVPCLNIDAKVGRGLIDAMSVIDQANNANITPEIYIIHIGNNELLSQDKLKRLNSFLDQNTKIIFLNLKLPRNYESTNNNEIMSFVEMHPDKVFLIDWKSYSSDMPNIFWKDGIHLNRTGTTEYSALISRKLYDLDVECHGDF